MHYFENDKSIKSEPLMTMATIKEKTLKLMVDNGVFSKKGLDFGTRSLLESLPLDAIKGQVLDFGCGYGPIGIYIAACTDAKVDMIDINERAIELAIKNADLNGVNVNVFESNLYASVTDKYDYIISNPPIRVGKEILYKILFEASQYLKKDGELWIVINKDQGAKSIAKDLMNNYKVTLVNKNKGFHIIKAQKCWLIDKTLLKL